VIATFVVSLRILPDLEQVGDLHHPHLLHDPVIIGGNLSDAGFFVVHLDAGKIFGETFLEPGVEFALQVAIH
jgi:hypothetical protein